MYGDLERALFDLSVYRLCALIENKLQETDKKGKPKHQLEKLLGIPLAERQGLTSVQDLLQAPR